MKILIREGSAAKNFYALISLLNDYPNDIMFCSDDKHPDSLVQNHINELCRRAVTNGIDTFKILRAACLNPVKHYRLDTGMLRENHPADFVLVKDLRNFEVIQTYINGICVAENGITLIKRSQNQIVNNFNCEPLQQDSIQCIANKFLINGQLPVIEALDGQLITNKISIKPTIDNGMIHSDVEKDVLKLIVVNRYNNAPPAISFIKNFGLKQGAIASSVAHDSHNIIAVGVDDRHIIEAVNLVIDAGGGITCVSEANKRILKLPVAGLMSNDDGYSVASAYTQMDELAKSLGSSLSAPFMTLSFMALLVIPCLKLSDLGLFDGDSFRFIKPS